MKHSWYSVVFVYAIVLGKFFIFFTTTNRTRETFVRAHLRRGLRHMRNEWITNDKVRSSIWPTEGIHYSWHPLKREDRFPSAEDRIRIYMGSWYKPPQSPVETFCYDYNKTGNVIIFEAFMSETPEFSFIGKNVEFLKPIVLDRKELQANINNPFSRDALDLLDLQRTLHDKGDSLAPLIVSFGDEFKRNPFPFFSKYRPIENHKKYKKKNLPIIARFHSKKHWGFQLEQYKKVDTPWYLKKNSAVWRGRMLGGLSRQVKEDEYYMISDDEQKCLSNYRCYFVLSQYDSQIIDAAFTHAPTVFENKDKLILGRKLWDDDLSMKEMLEFKMMINFEGRDVSPELKWQLLSKSVVLMPPPTLTSWALEEELEPWIHYVPIDNEGKSIEQAINWVKRNDREALKISERATLFMEDMLSHPSAVAENEFVQREIVRRYEKFWLEVPINFTDEE